MKRSHAALLAGAMIAATMLTGVSVASAHPSHRGHHAVVFNTSRTARNYAVQAMMGYTHMTAAALAAKQATGCSYGSIAASAGVEATQVVNTACARGQAVLDGLVRHHSMSRTQARRIMGDFRSYCRNYVGAEPSAPGASTPTTTCPDPCAPSAPATPTPAPGSNPGMNPGGCR